jgi:hypothetical protein
VSVIRFLLDFRPTKSTSTHFLLRGSAFPYSIGLHGAAKTSPFIKIWQLIVGGFNGALNWKITAKAHGFKASYADNTVIFVN